MLFWTKNSRSDTMRNDAIGVFDSGMGGLTAVKELNAILPHENIIYFGDTARIPYGGRDREMNFSTYVRYAISNVKSPNPEMRKLILKLINEVNHIGNNINQIVRNNNSGLYLDSDKTRLMEYMRLINFKIGALVEKYGD